MTSAEIIKWLAAQGVEVAIGHTVQGKRLYSVQDGRHNEAAFDKLLERIKAKESELMEYLEGLPKENGDGEVQSGPKG